MRARWILAVVASSPLTMSQELVKLVPSNGTSGDEFGTASIDGSLAVVGAPRAGSGAAYVYRRVAGQWLEEAELHPSEPNPGAQFGWSVAIDGSRVVVGAIGSGAGGEVYVYTRTGGTWSETAILAPNTTADNRFGRVAIEDDIIVVGDYRGNAAYVYRFADDQWTEEAVLSAGGTVPFDSFGIGVAIDAGRIIVGSRYETSSGAAHIFERHATGWERVQRITPSNGSGAYFGWYVAIEGDTVAVGAPYADIAGVNSGAVYIFEKDRSGWQERAILTGSRTTDEDYLGPVGLAQGRLIMGARYSDPRGGSSGEAYVFRKIGGGWVESLRLVPSDGEAGDTFGVIFDTSSSSLIIGAPLDDAPYSNSGSAYILDLEPPLDFPAVLRGGWLAALGHRLRAAAGLPR